MHLVALLLSALIITAVLWDAFETVVLPRSVTRRLRLTLLYVRATWSPWRRVATLFQSDARRERFLAVYGPIFFLGLAALWALGLVLGFAGLQWSAGSNLLPTAAEFRFIDDLYMSGTTFFTLGLGDLRPAGRVARAITVAEAGTGFAFLAIVIAYFPVLYQSFSRREVRLTLLDAWAGSPPAAAEVLRRLGAARQLTELDPFLRDWEYWCSELLESHISYPAVAYFRSQHQRQSWVSALATVLDLSAIVTVGIEDIPTWQARVTFAIARHAAVDLSQVLQVPLDPSGDRLPPADLEQLRRQLEEVGLKPARSAEATLRLTELRRSYEPYILGLSHRLLMPAPSWLRRTPIKDNWQTSPKGAADAHW